MTSRAHPLPMATGAVALLFALSACGGSSGGGTGDAAATGTAESASGDATRVVDVVMRDIAFDTTSVTVRAGETVEFRFANNGTVAHDAFVGDGEAQRVHEAEMTEMAGMEGMDDMGGHGTDEPAVTVQPGETGELSYTFAEAGTFEIGCHQPGHYAAGMKMVVTVD